MTCRLAVSIQRAAVTDERLMALLDVDTIQKVLQATYPQMMVQQSYQTVYFRIGVLGGSIQKGGRITVDDDSPRGRQLADELKLLLAHAADIRFAQEIAKAMQALGLGGELSNQEVTVQNAQQQVQQAILLTLNF